MICSLHLLPLLMTCVFLYKPVWTLIQYLADVNGFCSVACLYQELVSQNSVIRSIFVIVVSDLPSFPVAVKCILKSWRVKGGKGKTEQAGKQSLLETHFSRKKESWLFFIAESGRKSSTCCLLNLGVLIHCQCVGRLTYQLHVQYFAQRKAGKARKCKGEASHVVQSSKAELASCRCNVHWYKPAPLQGNRRSWMRLGPSSPVSSQSLWQQPSTLLGGVYGEELSLSRIRSAFPCEPPFQNHHTQNSISIFAFITSFTQPLLKTNLKSSCPDLDVARTEKGWVQPWSTFTAYCGLKTRGGI